MDAFTLTSKNQRREVSAYRSRTGGPKWRLSFVKNGKHYSETRSGVARSQTDARAQARAWVGKA